LPLDKSKNRYIIIALAVLCKQKGVVGDKYLPPEDMKITARVGLDPPLTDPHLIFSLTMP